jgi:hypothetical protein
MKKYIFFILTTLIFNGLLFTLTAQDITLPAPDKTGGMPLMQALNERLPDHIQMKASHSNNFPIFCGPDGVLTEQILIKERRLPP